jgi:DDE domain
VSVVGLSLSLGSELSRRAGLRPTRVGRVSRRSSSPAQLSTIVRLSSIRNPRVSEACIGWWVGSWTMSHGPSCVPVISTNAALLAHGEPVEVVTDRAPASRAAIDELMPAVFHNTERYANNRVECDHGRLKARLRPMWGLKHDHTARVIMRGHALIQNIRRGHHETRV